MKSSFARLLILMSVLSLGLTACGGGATSQPVAAAPSISTGAMTSEVAQPPPGSAATTAPAAAPAAAWLEIPLTDVRTGEAFKLSDFAGKVVILETMAVWCPLCTEQQSQIRAALRQVGENVVAVSVDVDRGEDAATLKAYATSKGLKWSFAIAPPELSQALVSDFGPAVLSPPATPVIIIDSSGTPHFTEGGIKNSATLVNLVNQYRP